MAVKYLLLLTALLTTLSFCDCKLIQELLKFSDLRALGSSPEAIKEVFHKSKGALPEGLSLNNENYGNGKSIASKYGKWCYKILGKTQYTPEKTKGRTKSIVGSAMAYNHGDEEAKVNVRVVGSWGETSSIQTSITTGMSFNAKYSVVGTFKMGMAFDFHVTAGSTESKTLTRSVWTDVTVTVPPHSKKEVEVVAEMNSVTMHFTKRIDVKGEIGANFGYIVKGHYFWFKNIATVIPKTSAMITGDITGTKAMKTNIVIGKAEPLTSYEEEMYVH